MKSRVLIALFLAGAVSACSQSSPPPPPVAPVPVSLMPARALILQQGQPTLITTPLVVHPEIKIWHYEHSTLHSSFQIEKEEVTASFQDPAAQEKYLQYWFQKWSGDKIKRDPLPKQNHFDNLVQYSDLEKHESVIYDRNSRRVVRVVQNAP